MSIAFADINEEKAKEIAEKSESLAFRGGYRAIAFPVDITNPSSVQRLVDLVAKDFGRIDYCINAAGVSNFHQNNYPSTLLTQSDRQRRP